MAWTLTSSNEREMLTLFTTLKPCRGHIGVIQRNAIQSWCYLRPSVEIIVFGDALGTSEVATEFGIHHISGVDRNEYGTPLVSAMFAAAERLSDSPLMCYVNADIILMSDFLLAVRRLATEASFLMVGRRWDLDLQEPLNFEQAGWEERLRTRAVCGGTLHSMTGIDYFVFPRGLWGALRPLAVGRPAWDNWIIYHARARGVRVIDATRVVTAVHQNHDYLHHPEGETGVWEGPEAKRNRELAGGLRCLFTLADATHLLTPWSVRPALSMTHVKRRLVTAPLFFPFLDPIVTPLIRIGRVIRNTIVGTTS